MDRYRFASSPKNSPFIAGLIAITLVILCAGWYHRAQQESEANRELVRRLASLLDLPAEAAPETLSATLVHYRDDREEARRARIARLTGMEPDWPQILQRIKTADSAQQATFYQAIIREYNLPNSWTQAKIAEYVRRGNGSSHVSDAVPMSDHLMKD